MECSNLYSDSINGIVRFPKPANVLDIIDSRCRNIPHQYGGASRDYMAVALFCTDLNKELSELIGVTQICNNQHPFPTIFPSTILLPVRFHHKQQITLRLYANAHEHCPGTTSQDIVQHLSSSLVGELVFLLADLINDRHVHQHDSSPAIMTGFQRTLRSSNGTGLASDGKSLDLALEWQDRCYNSRCANVLISSTLSGTGRGCMKRIPLPRSWVRVQISREFCPDLRNSEAKTWSCIVSTGQSSDRDPSWFVDQLSIDAITPDDTDPLHIKLWRSRLFAADTLIGEAFLRRSAVVKWITSVDEAGKGVPREAPSPLANQSSTRRLSFIGLAPKSIQLDLKSQENGSVVTAEMKLEIANINRVFSLFEYFSAGMRFDLTIAIDMHQSNGEPTDARSLHRDDPRGVEPSKYMKIMKPVLQLLTPYSSKLYPLGFGAQITNDSSALDYFHINRQKPSGLVNDLNELIETYHLILPCVKMGSIRSAGSLISMAIEDASRPMNNTDPHYTILLVFINGIPHDFVRIKKLILDAPNAPISIVFIGVHSKRSSASSNVESAFQKFKQSSFSNDKGAGRCNIQYIGTADRNETELCNMREAMMAELESQILSYMKEHHIAPTLIRPIVIPTEPIAGDGDNKGSSNHFADIAPVYTRIHDAFKTGEKLPSAPINSLKARLGRISSRPLNDIASAKDLSGDRMASLSRQSSDRSQSEVDDRGPLGDLSGLAPTPGTTSQHHDEKPAVIVQTDAEILKDKENAANAIRDRYRSSPQKGVLDYKARTTLRESIKLKLTSDAYEWKRKASMVTDTLSEANSNALNTSPHQQRRSTNKVAPNWMPKTIFNKNYS